MPPVRRLSSPAATSPEPRHGTLGDAVLVAITDATGDTVSAVMPSDLSAGTYELRVDVSTDFRRVFLFEVTP